MKSEKKYGSHGSKDYRPLTYIIADEPIKKKDWASSFDVDSLALYPLIPPAQKCRTAPPCAHL